MAPPLTGTTPKALLHALGVVNPMIRESARPPSARRVGPHPPLPRAPGRPPYLRGMTLDLRHLRYLVAVAEHGSVNRAAKALHMSQPPVSRQLAALERQLGAPLILRTSRGAVLTPAGEALVGAAPAVFAAVDAAVRAVRGATPAAEQVVRIGHADNMSYGFVPALLHRSREVLPGVRVEPRALQRRAQLARLHDGGLDVGLLWAPVTEAELGGLHVRRVLQQPLVVALPAGHRLAARRAVQLGELARETWLDVRPIGSSDRREAFYRLAAEHGFHPLMSEQIDSLPAALALVAAGAGVVGGPSVTASMAPTGVVTVPVTGLTTTLLAVTATAAPPPPVLAVVDVLADLDGVG